METPRVSRLHSRRELFDRGADHCNGPRSARADADAGLKVQFRHIELREDHYYSVPWRLKGTRVQVLYNDRMVEIYHDRGWQLTSARGPLAATPPADHMPRSTASTLTGPRAHPALGGCDRP